MKAREHYDVHMSHVDGCNSSFVKSPIFQNQHSPETFPFVKIFSNLKLEKLKSTCPLFIAECANTRHFPDVPKYKDELNNIIDSIQQSSTLV